MENNTTQKINCTKFLHLNRRQGTDVTITYNFRWAQTTETFATNQKPFQGHLEK